MAQLSADQRAFLGFVDQAHENSWTDADRAALRDRCARTRQRYQLPDVTLARLFLEIGSRLQEARTAGTAEGAPLGTLLRELDKVLDEIALLAAGLTRKERGRPPL